LACFLSAFSQQIDEKAASISIIGNELVADLPTENAAALAANSNADVLDINDLVVSRSVETTAAAANGRSLLRFRMPLWIITADKPIDWFRLRYKAGDTAGVISFSKAFKGFFSLRVMANEYIFSGTVYRIRARAVENDDGTPIGGLPVHISVSMEQNGNKENHLRFQRDTVTDSDGYAVADLSIPADAELDGDCTVSVTATRNGIEREASDDIRISDNVAAWTMADKPIYQPEQTLNLRALVTKGRPAVVLPDTDIEFLIKDEDDLVLYREKVRTSPFGIASMSWDIPANAKLGKYMVEVHRSNDEIGYQTIKISRYDLPNFSVTAKSDKEYYVTGENHANVDVTADYIFGKPVQKGKVRVVEESSRDWNWKTQRYDITEGQVREGETEANGKFTAKLDLTEAFRDLKKDSYKKFNDISFTAYFTDVTTNRTEQRRFDIRITKDPIHVYISNINHDHSHGLPYSIFVKAFYANGDPAVCDVELSGRVDSGKYKQFGRLRTNKYGVGKLTFIRPKIGDDNDDLDVIAAATDVEGRRGTSAEQTICYDSDDEHLTISTDHAIYHPGEPIRAFLRSTIKSGIVFVDVLRSDSLLASYRATLKDSNAEIDIPYDSQLKGILKLEANIVGDDDNIVRSTIGVLYPSPTSLSAKATFDKTTYKPGDEANAAFEVADSDGNGKVSALGISVIDEAVIEKADSDPDFGRMFNIDAGLLGYGPGIGSLNIKNVNDLGPNYAFTDDQQVAVEAMLADPISLTQFIESTTGAYTAKRAFSERMEQRLSIVKENLERVYRETDVYPADAARMRSILSSRGINFDDFRDEWMQPFHPIFSTDRQYDILTIVSAGPDKIFGTKDDINVLLSRFEYFRPQGKAIDAAVQHYYDTTGKFVRDEKTLLRVIESKPLDRFGRPFYFRFSIEGDSYVISIKSAGKDGKYEKKAWGGDDFEVWENKVKYFKKYDEMISNIQISSDAIPLDVDQFKATLKTNGLDLEALRDGWNRQYFVRKRNFSRYWDKAEIQHTKNFGEERYVDKGVITPVTQEVIEFSIVSPGPDAKQNTSDDLMMTKLIYVISERQKNADRAASVKNAQSGEQTSAISGFVKDAAGAVVPGATVILAATDGINYCETTSDEGGRYYFDSVSPGTYMISVNAISGFNKSVINAVAAIAGKTTLVDIVMSVRGESVTVDVSSDPLGASVDTSDSKIQTNISSELVGRLPAGTSFVSMLKIAPEVRAETLADGFAVDGANKNDENGSDIDKNGTKRQNSTPRLRQYFPETLFWSPETVTDADGKAAVKIKLADNITTWKTFVIASTKDGKVASGTAEMTVFRPFFVDLDPPKFLTVGDEISLPSQIRNYTQNAFKADVKIDASKWFSTLGPADQQVDVPAGGSKNAVFAFKATTPVKDGKQRLTATAGTDSDAVEKAVTVRPDGREIVATQSRYGAGEQSFGINFSSRDLPDTRQAELKVYPNLFANVTEAIDGLLQRPYGCGEQTISSSYPDLMIVRSGKGDPTTLRKARKYLQQGYERLLGYQREDGAFTFWGPKDRANVALTAYAIRFLNDASSQIAVDPDVLKRATDRLLKDQRADGAWTRPWSEFFGDDPEQTKLFTAYVARTLAGTVAKLPPTEHTAERAALVRALAFLKMKVAAVDEPYILSLYGLAALDAGDTAEASRVASQLINMAITEGSGAYWKLETNTPFYGWGTAGRVETTALAVQLLTRTKALIGNDKAAAVDNVTAHAMVFLLRNKDRYGVWYSTQTTINVLDTFIAAMDNAATPRDQAVTVKLNGDAVKTLTLKSDQIEPSTVPLDGKLLAEANTITVSGSSDQPVLSQIVSRHYIGWADADLSGRNENASRAIELDHRCDKTEAAIMAEITCTVRAERVGFKGYGMLLAEIGMPPGANVDRDSLEKALAENPSLSKYEILPDRIIFYMWAEAGGTRFNFKFRPRYAISAQAPASFVYDYYNPEAQATVAPLRFVVK